MSLLKQRILCRSTKKRKCLAYGVLCPLLLYFIGKKGEEFHGSLTRKQKGENRETYLAIGGLIIIKEVVPHVGANQRVICHHR